MERRRSESMAGQPQYAPRHVVAGKMSILYSGRVWAREDLGTYERIVLLCLADHADDQGRCFPSIARICTRCGMKERGVQGVLQRLVQRGLVIVEAGGGRRISNRYQIKLAASFGSSPQRAGDTAQTPHPIQETPQAIPESPHPVRGNLQGNIRESSEEDPLVVPRLEKHPKSRGSPLPEGWVPSLKNLSDAQDQNFSEEEIQHESRQFKDYHMARGSIFKDWDAAWRNWLGNARKFGRRGLAGKTPSGPGGRGGSLASIVARRRAGG
ncbi:MAG: hypothetical protein B7Y02_02025 [Rhodobacterales bacterium 17-64-5]|nr:MAG: hypothetical protein B7Y02_02025 [Rhodobacterales bacterium 17-64-5]